MPATSGKTAKFLSTPSARRATHNHGCPCGVVEISIHALREEGDAFIAVVVKYKAIFLSTPSARRATSGALSGGMAALISIHALREEGDLFRRVRLVVVLISIHALREEGDQAILDEDGKVVEISIHALREEGDQALVILDFAKVQFLSTPSARRATWICKASSLLI